MNCANASRSPCRNRSISSPCSSHTWHPPTAINAFWLPSPRFFVKPLHSPRPLQLRNRAPAQALRAGDPFHARSVCYRLAGRGCKSCDGFGHNASSSFRSARLADRPASCKRCTSSRVAPARLLVAVSSSSAPRYTARAVAPQAALPHGVLVPPLLFSRLRVAHCRRPAACSRPLFSDHRDTAHLLHRNTLGGPAKVFSPNPFLGPFAVRGSQRAVRRRTLPKRIFTETAARRKTFPHFGIVPNVSFDCHRCADGQQLRAVPPCR